MPDTGAPWNIPYVEAADLVSDWPADSLALANAIDAGLDAANVGIGSNVVSVVKTDTFSASVALGASTTVTGLSLSFTPTSATSKVLVLCQITGGRAAASRQYAALRAGGTLIDVGAAAGSRQQVGTGWGHADTNATSGTFLMALHSPATTSAVTYDVVVSHSHTTTDTVYVNRGSTDADAARTGRSSSIIVAIEVAA